MHDNICIHKGRNKGGLVAAIVILLDRNFECAARAKVGSLWVALPLQAPHFNAAICK